MILFGDFAVGKCGNCGAYFLVDADMEGLVNGYTYQQSLEAFLIEMSEGGQE